LFLVLCAASWLTDRREPDCSSMEEDPARAARRKEIEEKIRLAKEAQGRGEILPGAGKALTKTEIVKKLNTIPVFVVLNGDEKAVSLRDDENEGEETVFWHIEPNTAKAHLDVVIKQSPSIPSLHLGAMSLGVAFPLVASWPGATSTHAGDAGGVPGVASPSLRHKIVFPERVAEVTMPVFLCDQLQTQFALPVFFNRRDLAAAWIKSGRPKEACKNENIMVIDLRKFVDDLQTEKYALWSSVHFVPSGAAVEVLTRQQKQNEQAKADGDEPPALTS
jgi:hypothetical protein